jgi:hypothetical protein
MLTFSTNPDTAERQMQALLFYLTTFGYIDGDFDATEKAFVHEYLGKLVRHRIDTGAPEAEAALKEELTKKYTTHFTEVFERIDRHVQELFTEAVAAGENQDAFVHAKLKLRCFEIFKSFDDESQHSLMDTVDELIHADGHVHPAELKFRNELAELLEADLGVELEEDGERRPSVVLGEETELAPPDENHPFFEPFEFHYSRDPETIRRQLEADRELLRKAEQLWNEQGDRGRGRLTGITNVAELAGEPPFLDGHVYVIQPEPGESHELLVLGDLHGCYSNLKAAVLQARFFEKVEAYRRDPENQPHPKLVLLGDYIDRGLYSLNGVLRTVLQLFVRAPEHVYILRGNHEYYVEHEGRIYGGVRPAEAINSLKPHVEEDVFRDYMRLFDRMPSSLIFGGVLFVHGGIPRDRLIKDRFEDLTFLNDPDARFQMMWSDPSSADVIPSALQEQSARFPFGRLQAASFLKRIGCHTMVRGHEKVESGFERNYHSPEVTVVTLFSAGGTVNDDLPVSSTYRSVTPRALVVKWVDGDLSMTPFLIQYEKYNDPAHNAFFRAPAQITHAVE